MKSRMMKAAGLLLAGIMVFQVAYTTQGKETDKVSDGVSAGVTADLASYQALDSAPQNLDSALQTVDTNGPTAGVAGIFSEYMSETAVDTPDISEVDVSTTATGSQEASGAEEFGYTNLGIANVESNLNVRAAAGTDAEIVGKMPNNAGCEILATEGEWTKISSGKVEGYVKSEYLLSGEEAIARAHEVKQTIATVTATTLYVREQPNTDCEIITMMPLGEELEVIEQLDGWVKINVDSDEGYVSADYVEISTELAKAMTLTEVRFGQGVSDVRVSLVQYATQFVGNPYVWGGTSLTRGADCSGFVLSVFANYGISLPHSSRAQAGCGTTISASEAQPGDLFFYGSGSRINHVAIYIGGGQVVHASTPKSGIKISSAYYRTPVRVVRIINN